MFTTRLVTTSIAVLALALLMSCGKKEEPKTAAASPTAAAAPVPQAPPTPPAAAPVPQAPSTPPAAAAAPAATSAVLATADGEKPGVRVEVTELKRGSGNTVSLKFVLINDADENSDTSRKLGGLTHGYNVSGVYLVDAVNKKKYLVVVDSEKKCLCSDKLEYDVKPKSRLNLWAKFPAPPAEVQKVSIVIPHFSPVDDVPISQ